MGTSHNDRKRRRADIKDLGTPSKEDGSGATQTSKRAKVEDRRSLFIRSLPPNATNETVAEFFSEYFPVKHATVVLDPKTKESRGFGFVTFADAEDAKEAKNVFDKKEWDGRRIRVDLAEPRQRNALPGSEVAPSNNPAKSKDPLQKSTKLIIRNLPWSIKKSDQLAKLFQSFGKVRYADLPQTKGKLKGFGFVTLRGRPNAEKALEAINGKEIGGRTLAVDWAVDKNTWEQQKDDDEEDDEGSDDNDDKRDMDETGSVDANEASVGEEPVKNRDSELDADLANFMKNHLQNLEEEDGDEDEEIQHDDDDDEMDEIDESDYLENSEAPVAPARERMTDNSSTVFIRNMPFTTTDEQLKTFFGHFGKIRYARVVMDRVTEKPAGTGFVCFFSPVEAKACIVGAPIHTQTAPGAKHSILQDENADPSGKYTLDGRLLQVVQAVNKQEATNLADNALANRREKDKRRLYLLAEGAIGSNTPLYRLLSPSEVKLRETSAAQRKKLVQKNPSLHVSLTRLALRNVPRNIGSKEFKDLARKAVVGFAKDVKDGRRQPLSKEENARDGKDAKEKEKERRLKGKGIVKQAKIVYEDKKGSKVSEESGAGKSRGYGFIEYTSHHWALMGLRYLNGQQVEDESGKKQRLIAEFSIENAQVVQRRRAMEERSTQPTPSKNTSRADAPPDVAHNVRRNGSEARKGGKYGKKEEDEGQLAQTDGKKPFSAEQSMQHKLIARTRLMRKKKAAARGKR